MVNEWTQLVHSKHEGIFWTGAHSSICRTYGIVTTSSGDTLAMFWDMAEESYKTNVLDKIYVRQVSLYEGCRMKLWWDLKIALVILALKYWQTFAAHTDYTSYNSTFVSHFSKEKVTIVVKMGMWDAPFFDSIAIFHYRYNQLNYLKPITEYI